MTETLGIQQQKGKRKPNSVMIGTERRIAKYCRTFMKYSGGT